MEGMGFKAPLSLSRCTRRSRGDRTSSRCKMASSHTGCGMVVGYFTKQALSSGIIYHTRYKCIADAGKHISGS